MQIIEIQETESTNSWMAAHEEAVSKPALVYALRQTAGRGQRGNSWESAPGLNLTASAIFTPDDVEASCQFVVSEAVALAVCDTLRALGVVSKVKWPNDIYAGDRKICGILIENSLMGKNIVRSIAGVGININQTLFVSDAPNPVSVKMITDESIEIAEVAGMFAAALERRLSQVKHPESLHNEYMANLWRADSAFYPFRDKRSSGNISARIENVAPDGILTLFLDSGELRKYAFKEVEFII